MSKGNRINKAALICITASVSLAGPVMAESVPDAGSLLRQQQESQRSVLPREIPNTLLPEQARSSLNAPQGKRIHVVGFHVVGVLELFPNEVFTELLKDYTDRDLTLQELQAAAGKVADYYREHGYFLAKAYVSKQKITDGIVTLTVVEGRIEGSAEGDGIAVKGDNLRLDEDRIRQTIASAIAIGEPVNQDDLERGLLILNDLPGITAKSNLEQGAGTGTTKLTINATEGDLITGNLGFDNFGNRYTGLYRANTGASLNDPFGLGDILSLDSSISTTAGLKYLRGTYQLPVGNDGLKLNASLSGMTYNLGNSLQDLDGKGYAITTELGGSYPIVRSRAENLTVQSNYDHNILNNQANGATTSDKLVDKVSSGLVGSAIDSLGGGGLNQASLTGAFGWLDLSGLQSDLDSDRTTARTSGRFAKLLYSANRLQHIDEGLNFFLGANGQLASKNLDSSEKFQLGGAYGVRAYPTGEAAGDSGHKLTAELRWDLPVESGWLPVPQLIGFYDQGWICQNHKEWAGWSSSGQSNCYALQGAGFGVNLIQSGSYELHATYAHAIGNNPGRSSSGANSDGTKDGSRAWLQFGIRF